MFGLLLTKIDTDSLQYRIDTNMEVYQYPNSVYYEMLKGGFESIKSSCEARHARNPNNCQHEFTVIGNKRGCLYCMGKFGTVMSVDIMDN
jgi:hypothetical protein